MSWEPLVVPNPPPDNVDTTEFNFRLPDYAGDTDVWGHGLNGNWYALDTILNVVLQNDGASIVSRALLKAGGEMAGDTTFAANADVGSAAKPANSLHTLGWTVYASYGGASRATCGTDGIVNAVNFVATSDARLKKNITPLNISDFAAKAQRIVPSSYQWIEDGQRDIGVIAQDVQAVFPAAVIEGDDGVLRVSWPKLCVMLIASVQHLQSQIDAMKATK